jgi:hypothetical protein
VQAHRQSLSKEENAIVCKGAMPPDWKPASQTVPGRDSQGAEKQWTGLDIDKYLGLKKVDVRNLLKPQN